MAQLFTPLLGSEPRANRAVVIGAGIAGLAACGALAPHIREVVLIEQDLLTDDLTPRRRIPQAAHVHALLDGGRAALESLFPGLRDTLEAAGSLPLKVRSQWRTHDGHAWCAPSDTGPVVLSQSRAMLESTLLRRVMSLPRLRLVQGKVTGFGLGPNGRIAEVSFLDQNRAPDRIATDLVIDASGRAGKSLSWLTDLGCSALPIETSAPGVAYASTCFARQPDAPISAWLKPAQAPATRGLVVAPIEDNRWIVTMTGRFGVPMPQSEADFRTLLAEVADLDLAHMLRDAPLTTRIQSFRIATVRLRRFDLFKAELPPGYLPIGDSIATFNPLYGQGMSVGALQAVALRDTLHSCSDLNAVQALYLERAMRPTFWAWSLGQAVDRAFAPLNTHSDPAADQLGCDLRRAFAVSVMRPDLRSQVDRVLHLLDPPSVLQTPAAKVS